MRSYIIRVFLRSLTEHYLSLTTRCFPLLLVAFVCPLLGIRKVRIYYTFFFFFITARLPFYPELQFRLVSSVVFVRCAVPIISLIYFLSFWTFLTAFFPSLFLRRQRKQMSTKFRFLCSFSISQKYKGNCFV